MPAVSLLSGNCKGFAPRCTPVALDIPDPCQPWLARCNPPLVCMGLHRRPARKLRVFTQPGDGVFAEMGALTGPAWSLTLEGASLWCWWRRRWLLGSLAVVLTLAGPLGAVGVPVWQSIQATERAEAARAAVVAAQHRAGHRGVGASGGGPTWRATGPEVIRLAGSGVAAPGTHQGGEDGPRDGGAGAPTDCPPPFAPASSAPRLRRWYAISSRRGCASRYAWTRPPDPSRFRSWGRPA
jgi:hypothetical protein